MKFLIIGEEAMWTAGAWRLQELEYQDVRIFCSKKEGKDHLKGIVEHVQTLEQGLIWVGRDGYIISEDEQDVSALRRRGFKVYGGNSFTKRMENDRQFEMEVCKKAGIKIPDFHHIKTIDEGIRFIKSNPDAYALKQGGHLPKEFNYVGKEEDGSDVILQLEWIKNHPAMKKVNAAQFMLQEVVDGIEFACGAWWMAGDWKRDDDGSVIIELNREHKKMLNGDLGISCGEMGTVAQFTTEHTKLFEETLEKLTPVLKEEAPDVILDIDANCGITDEGIPYVFEITPREGYPICALQHHLLDTELSTFMSDLIDKKQGGVEWKKGWGIVSVVGTGDFPHESIDDKDVGVTFREQPVEVELSEHVTPGYLYRDGEMYRVADDYAWVANVCHSGESIGEVNAKCVKDMEKVGVRSPVYRTDIGEKFETKDIPKLESMGFL